MLTNSHTYRHPKISPGAPAKGTRTAFHGLLCAYFRFTVIYKAQAYFRRKMLSIAVPFVLRIYPPLKISQKISFNHILPPSTNLSTTTRINHLPSEMSHEANRELARLWRVSRTVHEMVRDRVSHGTQCSVFIRVRELVM